MTMDISEQLLRGALHSDSKLARVIDGDASSDGSDLSDFEDDFSYPASSRQYDPRTANTGPKGVIADRDAFEASKRADVASGRARREQRALERAPIANTYAQDGELEDEEEALRLWREKRMRELTLKGPEIRGRDELKLDGRRMYGTVEDVDAEGYLDAVETSETTVVFIYDELQDSELLSDALPIIAQRYPRVRFVKLHFLEAEMDSVAIPALLCYRQGDLVANLVRVVDEIPLGQKITTQSIEAVLTRHELLERKDTANGGESEDDDY
ncbi:thioredoxin-like protein [Saitoella complicata NRRL Y-17804]|uniref:Phosducin domain-containing protein n=1 Tax=Saitoella complicata (strain BCRC 22490 / CBS 7301 / JCM 7358 / NBRC 10748 / NRRL Y-17804) TaxID=698492 RepID=A0A0E9N8X3_SAICN|nr:thioredoxin-like protein [Saitoella complicata NRRL Y-17804]ODQ54390.1 thioredoxin-like protein [Saitoella complicata NRRL Y-17804]GAO45850.1 hypothetical protein G7K_0098-t1 [Saitoella complicata NRRL Y-17804]